MKKLYLFILAVFLFSFSFATTINDNVNNGNWKNASTWDKNRKPQDGDTVVIPAGKTVVVNSWETLNNLVVKVYGTLQFSGFLSALQLNSTSSVIVYNNASIEATVDYFQYLIIGGAYVFYQGLVAGPVKATSTGLNTFNPLPVKFESFSAVRKGSDVLIEWSASEEVNVSRYEVERSEDGVNWSVIAYETASGNSSAVSNYSFTDKNVSFNLAYYRIREVDQDGSSSFSSTQSVRAALSSTTGEVRIASTEGKILLEFPRQIKGEVIIRFVSFNGQVVHQQTLSDPLGKIVLNSNLTGNYIISVSNGQDISAAKQVVL